jgi:hypothetical protein
MTRRSLLGCVVALAFACSACAVDTTVSVRVHEDGSGVVTARVVADAEAVHAVEVGGGTLETRVRLSDLPAAGWTVKPWVRHPDGSASLTLRKPFARLEEVEGILGELNGSFGPLRDASFSRHRSFFATKFAADVIVDLAAMTTGVAQDPELVAALQAQGVDVGIADQQLLAQLRDALVVRMVVDLPGGARTVVEPAKGQSATLSSSTSVSDTRRIRLVVAAGLLVVAALVVVLWPRRRARRRAPTGRGASEEAPLEPLSWREPTPPTRRRSPRGS